MSRVNIISAFYICIFYNIFFWTSFSVSKKTELLIQNFQNNQSQNQSINLNKTNHRSLLKKQIYKKTDIEIQASLLKSNMKLDTLLIDKTSEYQPLVDINLPKTFNRTSIFSDNQNKHIDDFYIYQHAINIKCNISNCQLPNFCSEDRKACICAEEFAEFTANSKNNDTQVIIPIDRIDEIPFYDNLKKNELTQKRNYCNYLRIKQSIYFILEFLFNIGAGHFYAKNYLLAALKMGLVLLPWTIIFILIISGVSGSECFKDIAFCGTATAFFFVCVSVIWWIVDAILIGMKYYTDGNGVPLLSW